MNRFYRLKNHIMPYEWGSDRAIPELLGRRPEPGKPQAELWMGAHPKAPSNVLINERWTPLDTFIAQHPQEILGPAVARKFGNRLPYLFKVLAAAEPLSLQAHPSREQARQGFKRENRQGIGLDDPTRNYKDDNHKPECIYALSNFWALNGFRKISEALDLFGQLAVPELSDILADLKRQPDAAGLKLFFERIMRLSEDQKRRITAAAVNRIQANQLTDPVFKWMLVLAEAYPGDIGMFSPIFLNLICLEPGQALFLPAGELHAYLEGVGIELMANSDNVLRGGLTSKHVDIDELLNVLRFEERRVQVLSPEPDQTGTRVFAGPAEEFVLEQIDLRREKPYQTVDNRSVEILLCTRGHATLTDPVDLKALPLRQGTSVLIPAGIQTYFIAGSASLFKASVPLESFS